MANCVSKDTLKQYIEGRLASQHRSEVAVHLRHCPHCQTVATGMFLRQPRVGQAATRTVDDSPWLQTPFQESSQKFADAPTQSLNESDFAEPVRPLCLQCDQAGLAELGRLRILGKLGEGAFSVVYLTEDSLLKRQVALKMPRAVTWANPTTRKRFLREAQAAANLHHPNIVPLYGAGEVEGTCYVTLAYCAGPTLAQWLKDGRPIEDTEPGNSSVSRRLPSPPLAPRVAARVVLQLADALEHAHCNGILHRDIKPGNILLEPKAAAEPEFPFTPMLADFGLARLNNDDPEITAEGVILGTPQYMAPEQAAGRQDLVVAATDVYAMGAVFYELLTGGPPIPASSTAEMLAKLADAEPVRPRRLIPGFPSDLEAICLKCLEKQPQDRYASAGELAEDLRRFQAGQPVRARPVRWWERARRCARRHPSATGLVLLSIAATALILVALAVFSSRLNVLLAATERAYQEAEASERKAQQLLYASDMQLASRAAKDQDWPQLRHLLERHRPQPGEFDLRGFEWHYLEQLGETGHVTLASLPDPVYFVRYSPDQRWIAAAGKDSTVRIYDRATTAEILSLRTGQGEVNGVAFSPDGRILAAAGDDGTIRLWDLQQQRQTLRIAAYAKLAYQVEFARHGKLLVCCGDSPVVRVWDANSGELLAELLGHEDSVQAITVSPDGCQLASASDDHTARIWDLRSLVESRVIHQHDGKVTSAAFSADGSLLATGCRDGTAGVHRLDTGERIAEFISPDGVQAVAFSPDGRMLVTADRGGAIRQWEFPERTEEPKWWRVASAAATWPAHDGRAMAISISRDGRQIASAGWDGSVKAWKMARAPIQISYDLGQYDVQGFVLVPARCLLVSVGDAAESLLVWDLTTRREVGRPVLAGGTSAVPQSPDLPVNPVPLDSQRWDCVAASPDGHWVAAGDRKGVVAVWDLDSRSRAARWDLGRPVEHVQFTRDGSRLAAACVDRADRKLDVVHLLSLADGSVVASVPTAMCHSISVSPDASQLAASSGDDAVVWDLKSRSIRHLLRGHREAVHQVVFSPDGTLVACGSRDRTISLWGAATGRRRFLLTGHREPISALAFAPDGRSLVSGEESGALKVWNAATGQQTCELLSAPLEPRQLQFCSDGRRLLCLYRNSRVGLLDWRPLDDRMRW